MVFIVVPCWVVEMEGSEFISKSNSSFKNAMSLWPSSLLTNVPITDRDLIGPGPINDRVTITDRDFE